MEVRKMKVDFVCPECGVTSFVEIGQMESGSHQCDNCQTVFSFDKAFATGLRDSIEQDLEELRASFQRIAKMRDK